MGSGGFEPLILGTQRQASVQSVIGIVHAGEAPSNSD